MTELDKSNRVDMSGLDLVVHQIYDKSGNVLIGAITGASAAANVAALGAPTAVNPSAASVDALTDNTGGTPSTTLASISDTATKNAVASLAAEIAKLATDCASLRTQLTAAIADRATARTTLNAEIAALKTAGLQASS